MSATDGLCYLHAFPSTEWAKKPGRVWRNVVLHVQAQQLERADIPGPLALISNRRGTAQCRIDERDLQLNEDMFALSVPGATFTLRYDDSEPVETLNVHFSDALVSETLAALAKPNELDAEGIRPSDIVPVVRRKSPAVAARLRALHDVFTSTADPLCRASTHMALLMTLLAENPALLTSQTKLSALRRTTRLELLVRLSRAVDYMHTCYAQPLDLRALARVSCLSRFHFLRSFKALMGFTPQRYLARLRLAEARRLLLDTALPLGMIAQRVGYAEASSLSRAFKRHLGTRPSSYRTRVVPSRGASSGVATTPPFIDNGKKVCTLAGGHARGAVRSPRTPPFLHSVQGGEH